MDELKKYADWIPILEAESFFRVYDDDGARALQNEGRLNTLITKKEAFHYFMLCTMVGKGSMEDNNEYNKRS